MENEGIMSLPEGQAMQNQGPANQPIYVSSADTYDAALTALGASTNDPAQAEAVRQAVRESIADLELSPTELDSLLEILEYMSQNPKEYPQIRQRLIEMGMMDPDDLPEAYDPAYLGMAIMALNEYQATKAQGAQAPMEMAPTVEGLEPMPMAEGGLADMAKYLASFGQRGDTILAHITPAEARLLKSMGGSGSINPHTKLPQFFLGKIFKKIKKAVKSLLKNPIVRIVATVALATVLGPAAASVVGAATGTAAGVALSTTAAAASTALASTAAGAAVSAMAGEKINAKSLLINAATSYFGAGGTIGGVNPVGKLTEVAAKLPGVTAGSAVAKGIGSGLTSAGIGKLAGLSTEEALGMGLQSGIMAGYQQSRQIKALQAKPDLELKNLGYNDGQIANIRQGLAPDTPVGPATRPTEQMPTAKPQERLQGGAYDIVPGGSDTPNPDAMRGVVSGEGSGQGIYGSSAVEYTSPRLLPGATAQTELSKISPIPTEGGGGAAVPSSQAPGMISRIGDFLSGKKYYTLPDGTVSTEPVSLTNTFGVNPFEKPGTLARYAPGVATALAVTGATGGFKSAPAEESPLFNRSYFGMDYMRDNPQYFQGGIQPAVLTPYNPVVATPSYGLGTTAQPYQPIPYTAPPMSAPVYVPSPPRPPGYARGGVVDNAMRMATSNPVNVAQTEAMLFAGPQAAQQAGMAVQALDRGGIMGAQRLRKGGQPTKFPRKTGPINGPGTGTSDSIPAMLSDGEFVFTAKAVRNAGQGSRRKGARRMYKLMKMLEGGNVKGN